MAYMVSNPFSLNFGEAFVFITSVGFIIHLVMIYLGKKITNAGVGWVFSSVCLCSTLSILFLSFVSDGQRGRMIQKIVSTYTMEVMATCLVIAGVNAIGFYLLSYYKQKGAIKT